MVCLLYVYDVFCYLNRTLVLLTPIRCTTLYFVLTLHLTSLSRVPSKRVIAVNGSRVHAGLYVCSFNLLWFECLHVYAYTCYCPTLMALYDNGNN